MIHTILDELKQKVLDLKFIERYGGLVIPVTTQSSEDGRPKSITFPVSYDAKGMTCYISEDYYELAPSDRYRSVAYWEIKGDATPFAPRRGNRNTWYGFRQPVRLVVWLNMLALGEANTSNTQAEYLAMLAINALQGMHDIQGVNYSNQVKFKLLRMAKKSMDIFSEYSYRDRTELMLYPFDFFAIDFEVEWYVRRNCLPQEALYNKICLPESMLVKSYGGFTIGFSQGFNTILNTHKL